MKRTKVIATIGPACEDEETIRKMVKAGLNVARLNFSHGSYEEYTMRKERVLKVSQELNMPVSLLLDTKGPEIRTGMFKDGPIALKEGQKFTFTVEEIEGDAERCSISYKELYKAVRPGDRILVSDGLIAFTIKSIEGTDIVCQVENPGLINSRKNANVPGVSIPLPFLSEKDKADIKFGVENGFDYIAASFTRNDKDLQELRAYLKSLGDARIKLIAKIENHEGIENFSKILTACDGVMVARGDLGVEIPLERVPIAQKDMIKRARKAGKIVITATQMLDSMINNPRPTRAEVTDVAYSVMQGVSAVMLSGETAAGKHPVESVKMMAKIAKTTEEATDFWAEFYKMPQDFLQDVGPAIGRAACDIAASLAAKTILVLTETGYTAQAVARYRPACPIVARATNEGTRRQLALIWGVSAFVGAQREDFGSMLEDAVNTAKSNGFVEEGDLIVIVAGVPIYQGGSTNFLKAHRVGQPLL